MQRQGGLDDPLAFATLLRPREKKPQRCAPFKLGVQPARYQASRTRNRGPARAMRSGCQLRRLGRGVARGRRGGPLAKMVAMNGGRRVAYLLGPWAPRVVKRGLLRVLGCRRCTLGLLGARVCARTPVHLRAREFLCVETSLACVDALPPISDHPRILNPAQGEKGISAQSHIATSRIPCGRLRVRHAQESQGAAP